MKVKEPYYGIKNENGISLVTCNFRRYKCDQKRGCEDFKIE
jgi:hypothetical protein